MNFTDSLIGSADYGSSSSTFVFAILALLLAIVATVLAFIFIVPDKRRPKLNAFGKFLHDTCNFKYLLVEKILQALYIFATVFTILNGFFMLFKTSYGHWLGGIGILTMILGPIAIRLVYELLMMIVLLLKNVISINNKLTNKFGEDKKEDLFSSPDLSEVQESFKQRKDSFQNQNVAQPPVQTYQPTQVQPQNEPVEPFKPEENAAPHFCMKCGAPLDQNGNCPNCSK